MLDRLFSRAHIRESLDPQPSAAGDDMLWLADAPPDVVAKVRASMPAIRVPAAVLVPLVERADGMTVLLTQRAATLKDHAGQISFPGGRIEREDADSWRAALREAHEEIGLTESFVEFAGYLPDHWVGTGFRVTPVVGFVNPAYGLRIATDEVHDAFEVPLEFIFNESNHKARTRELGGVTLEVRDIPYGERNIWGATAGMLLTLRRLLLARSPRGSDPSASGPSGTPGPGQPDSSVPS
jgi:8-oxo-dGTP pyrophosphatase MutT (NUDIX family)